MRIKNRILTATLYTYVQPVNAKRAKVKGQEWGSFSNYINYLIAKDHGDKTSIKASTDMKEIFLTPSPARTSTVKKPAKKAKAKGKKSKRGSARRSVTGTTTKSRSASPRVSKKTARKPVTSSRKVASKKTKPGKTFVSRLLKMGKRTNTTANHAAA